MNLADIHPDSSPYSYGPSLQSGPYMFDLWILPTYMVEMAVLEVLNTFAPLEYETLEWAAEDGFPCHLFDLNKNIIYFHENPELIDMRGVDIILRGESILREVSMRVLEIIAEDEKDTTHSSAPISQIS